MEAEKQASSRHKADTISTPKKAKKDAALRRFRAFGYRRNPVLPSIPTQLFSDISRIKTKSAAALAQEYARGTFFNLIPVAMGAGAATYFNLSFEPDLVLVLGAVGFFLILVICLHGRLSLRLCTAGLLFFSLGMTTGKLETMRAGTSVLGGEISTTVTARVVRVEQLESGRYRILLDIVETERPNLRHAPERVRLTAREVPEDLRPGDVIKGFARLAPPSGPVRPGGYDFSLNNYFKGIGAFGFFMGNPIRVSIQKNPSLTGWIASEFEHLRSALADRIRRSVSGPEAEVAIALIVGYRPGIPENVNEWLRRSGVFHVLSISGLHMALVALTVMQIVRYALALFPAFAARLPVKKISAAVALLFCTLYLFMSGMDVAAQRSYLMLAVMLIALLMDRQALSMRNVAIAAIIILVTAPHEVIGPSFQMSFAATAALVAGYRLYAQGKRTGSRSENKGFIRIVGGKILGLIAAAALTSLVAGAASSLYGIWHFQRATPLTVLANVAISPIVSIIIMPAAVFSALALPVGAEGIFLRIMTEGIGLMIAISRWFSDHTPFDAVGLLPLSTLLCMTTGLILLLLVTTRLRYLSFLFFVIGTVAIAARQIPDVYVSEDARLIGIYGLDGSIGVNRPRPNRLTIDDWSRSGMVATVLRPISADTETNLKGQFVCENSACIAHGRHGARILHTTDVNKAALFCGKVAVIILEDATAKNVCAAADDATLVITARHLSLYGSAAIRFSSPNQVGNIKSAVQFSVGEPLRPWHEHRRWSRSARGLAKWEPKK